MVKVKTDIRSSQVRNRAEHKLFVEGEGESLDKVVMKALLGNTLSIDSMGPSYSLQSAAQALAQHHPCYYFLIDRDHHDDKFVERCWERFPEVDQGNLLVWRRREIENYFLEPAFLAESEFCVATAEKLQTVLVQQAQKRLFLDILNYVIVSVREEQKKTWIKHFKNPEDFPSRQAALEKLTSLTLSPEGKFSQRTKQVSDMLEKNALKERFDQRLESMTGSGETLVYGEGRWIEMISGKKLLPQLLNSGYFTVKGADGQALTGVEMQKEIVKELAVKPVASRPEDLRKLRQLIEERVTNTIPPDNQRDKKR